MQKLRSGAGLSRKLEMRLAVIEIVAAFSPHSRFSSSLVAFDHFWLTLARGTQ